MQGGGGGGGGIRELARQASAAARTEPAARLAALQPVRKNYRGVQQRKNRYYAVIWNTPTARPVWLGSYETPEEAAYAYDAAARVMRGHRAKPNFPEPAPARAAPQEEEVATDLVLAAPAHCSRLQQQAEVVARQVSFDNWLAASEAAAQPQHLHQQSTPSPLFPHHHQQQRPAAPLPPFTQFFHLADPATAAAANGGAATAVVNPSVPGAYILTAQNVQMSPTNPASTALSSTEPVVDAAPTHQHRELPVPQASVSDQAVVGDNFNYNYNFNDGASSSAAAPPPVPRLTLQDLVLRLDLPGRGGSGGAQ